MNLDLFTNDINSLFPFLETILQDGGQRIHEHNLETTPSFNVSGISGYHYKADNIQGEIGLGLILGGTGYVLKRSLMNNGLASERFDHYNLDGEITFTSDKEALKSIIVDFHQIDLTCPILNHFYNYLAQEYNKASEGKSQTQLVHSVERLLKQFYVSKDIRLSIQDKANDSAILNIYNKILAAEMDPILRWDERQIVFGNFHKELKKIVTTKIRAHRLSKTTFAFLLFSKNVGNFTARVIARPLDNLQGLLYKYTVGKCIWFVNTVKNNLGYSIALAVYGPFTYYFITMPMNPHAMQAVGRVRSAYLETKAEIVRILTKSDLAINDLKAKEAIAADTINPTAPAVAGTNAPAPQTATVTDTVQTAQAAPQKVNNDFILANIINPSVIAGNTQSNYVVQLGSGKANGKTNFLNMPLTTDLDIVNKTTWTERMSNFKQMQIAYEENIEYASRMGRLEQLETQYNFPMQIEAAWEELERYNSKIFKLREENPNISAKMKQFLFNEINRTQQLELYLWDRMGRFILDQVYVMLDQDKEQKRSDYYVGRSFVFMEEMTNILSWRYKDLKKPEGYEKIEALAKAYTSARKEAGTVLKNLAVNSDLFKQKDVYDTKEFRSHMKRQWEILFLQNSKAEEASNMGLNMYIWSVRNTAWILQTIYAAKTEELDLLIKRDVSGKLLTPAEMLSRSKVSMLYETLLHNLTLEYVGIREEIMNRIGKDIESSQRMVVIENLKEFLTDRDKLDNLGMANNQKTAEAKL